MLASRRRRMDLFTQELGSNHRRRECKATHRTFNRTKLYQAGYNPEPPAADVATNEPFGIKLRRIEIEELRQEVKFLDDWHEDLARQMKEMRVEELSMLADIKEDNDVLETDRVWVRLGTDKILRERGCFQRLRTRSISNIDIFGTVDTTNPGSSTGHPATTVLSTENSMNDSSSAVASTIDGSPTDISI